MNDSDIDSYLVMEANSDSDDRTGPSVRGYMKQVDFVKVRYMSIESCKDVISSLLQIPYWYVCAKVYRF